MMSSDAWFGGTRPSQDHDDGGNGMAVQCGLCGVGKIKNIATRKRMTMRIFE